VGSSSSFLVVLDLASILLSHRSWLSLVECLCRSFRLPLEFSSLRKAFFCLIRFLSCRSRFQYSSSVPDLIYLFLASSRHAFFSCSPDPVSVQKIFLRLLFFARSSVSMSRFRSSRTTRVSEFLPGFPAQELQENFIVFVGTILSLSLVGAAASCCAQGSVRKVLSPDFSSSHVVFGCCVPFCPAPISVSFLTSFFCSWNPHGQSASLGPLLVFFVRIFFVSAE
jgi:hypothetical protein